MAHPISLLVRKAEHKVKNSVQFSFEEKPSILELIDYLSTGLLNHLSDKNDAIIFFSSAINLKNELIKLDFLFFDNVYIPIALNFLEESFYELNLTKEKIVKIWNLSFKKKRETFFIADYFKNFKPQTEEEKLFKKMIINGFFWIDENDALYFGFNLRNLITGSFIFSINGKKFSFYISHNPNGSYAGIIGNFARPDIFL